MEKNNYISKLLRFIDSDLFSVYSDILEWVNTSSYYLDDNKIIDHPLKNFAWCSYSTMANRLNINRSSIGNKIDILADLGLITKYTYNFILKDRVEVINTFNTRDLPKINQYYKRVYNEDPMSREFKKIKPIDLKCRVGKVFIKIDTELTMPYFVFKHFLLLNIRKLAREKNKKFNLEPRVIGMLISKSFDRIIGGTEFSSVKKFIEKNISNIDIDLDYDAIEIEFNRLKGKISFEDYKYVDSFDTSILNMSEILKTTPNIEIDGEVFDLNTLHQSKFIQYVARHYNLSEFLEVAKSGKYLFFFMFELFLRKGREEDVNDAWDKFKRKNFNWRSMSLLHLLRSFRKYIHYSIVNNNTEIERVEQDLKTWYIRKERTRDIELPTILSVFEKEISKFEFFKYSFYKSDTGELIYPFYFFSNYVILDQNKENYYPDWLYLIKKYGGTETKELKILYAEIISTINEEVDRLIDMGILKNKWEDLK